MRPDPLVPHTSDESASHASLVRLLSAGHLSLIVATFPLWRPQRLFPQVPLISIAGRIPEFVEWGLLGILIASIGVMLFPARPQPRRIACLIMGLSTFLLVLIDQHRLQPWAWQFIILSLVLATSDNATSRTSWQWLIISIYAWSAWSKMDQGFFISHGRFLLEGLAKSIGLTQGTKFWPEWLLGSATISIPVFEMLVAFGLAWPATRRFAVILAAMMHVTLLLALGPFGHGHQPGVLFWNLFFLIQNGLLFRRGPTTEQPLSTTPSTSAIQIRNSLAHLAVVAAMAWPSVESFGLCDHWPAWAVYAAKPERVTVYVDANEISQSLQSGDFDSLKTYLGPQTTMDDWQTFRIDRWSLETVHAPIYPQDRFQIGVAIGLTRMLSLHQIRVVVEGPANRWTGQRTIRAYTGRESLIALDGTFRCNALPRSE